MTEPVPDKRGFEHKNVFYEYVPLDEWLNRDFTLARTLTRVGIDDLLAGGRDYNAIQQASLAVGVAPEPGAADGPDHRVREHDQTRRR